MSKWFLLLMFVPLENALFFIMLLFKGRTRPEIEPTP